MATEKRKNFSCDFETTTQEDDCRVWAWGSMEVGNEENYQTGTSIESFMAWCEKTNGNLYFHNLKFDGAFIVNWLLHNGFKRVAKIDGEPNTFSTMISAMGQWYAIDICYGGTKRKKRHTVIRDSLKKLPFSVKAIAQAFKLDVQKGELDYKKFRPVGHVLTEEEHAYLRNDVEIMAKALKILFDQNMVKSTIGSDALSDFKDIFTKKKFDKMFPGLSHDMDSIFRHAYRGGFTWVNPKFQGLALGEGTVYDVVSLYPSQMYYRPLPYGMPVYFKGKYEPDEEYNLYIAKIRCEFKLKKGHVPTIQLKKNPRYKPNEYITKSDGREVMYVTNLDWELIEKHYHVYDVEYVEGWMFKSHVGFFNDYIDKWMEVKNEHSEEKGALYNLAKLMLNNLYGKFATNPDKTGKIPFLKEDGSTGFETDEENIEEPIYLPMGIFITSWARYTTISAVQSCYDRIIYCDTDSMHLVGLEEPTSIKVTKTELGTWSLDEVFKRCKYLRQKTYIQVVDKKNKETGELEEKLVVKCAGMPDNIKKKVTFDNFEVGFSEEGKLMYKHVNGGVILKETRFTIK